MREMRGLVLVLLLAACSDDSPNLVPESDTFNTSPEEVAHDVLTAYRAKDLAALRKLCLKQNRPTIDELIAEGDKSPRYRSIFGGWRWEQVQAWEGKVGEARYGKRHAEVLARGIDEVRVLVVKLEKEEGEWRFDDLSDTTRFHFENELSKEPGDGIR